MKHVNQNNLFTQTLELYQEDNRTPLDCSNATFVFMIKKDRSDPDDQAVLPPITYEKPDTNILCFEYTAPQMNLLDPGVYIMALKIYREDDMNEELWIDQLTIEKGVFHD